MLIPCTYDNSVRLSLTYFCYIVPFYAIIRLKRQIIYDNHPEVLSIYMSQKGLKSFLVSIL